jgi:hypothetical protein
MTLDMDDVARCAWGEILQTAPHASSLFAFLEDLLEPGPQLVWQGRGPGRGTEMRRAFSALFGRFFARAYLETYHGFTWFAAIDGDNFLCPPNFRVKRKRGAHTEMPDWLCGGPGGLVAIAEAKGSHQRGNAGGHGKPGPIRTAEGQIAGVLVQELVARAGKRVWQSRAVKGWAVMSRWGVASPAREPYLFALDPKTDGEPLSPDGAKTLEQAIARVHVEQIARGLGLVPRTSGAEQDPGYAPFEPAAPRVWPVRFQSGEDDRTFLGRFVTPFGPLDIDPKQAKALSENLPNPAMLRFVGLDADILARYRDNAFLPARQRVRIGEAALIGADGLAIAPMNQITVTDQIGRT